jgi:hypothetical protein
MPAKLLDAFFSARRFGYQSHIRLTVNYRRQAFAQKRVVVNTHHSNLFRQGIHYRKEV